MPARPKGVARNASRLPGFFSSPPCLPPPDARALGAQARAALTAEQHELSQDLSDLLGFPTGYLTGGQFADVYEMYGSDADEEAYDEGDDENSDDSDD